MKKLSLALVIAILLQITAMAQINGCDSSPLNSAEAYIVRSQQCLDLNSRDLEQAFADADRAVELAPDLPAAYSGRAEAHLWLGQRGQALVDGTIAVQLDPDNTRWLMERGFLMLQVDDLDGAIADASRSITLHPDNAQLYLHRSNYYEQIEQSDAATSDMKEAVQLEPTNAAFLEWLGDLYFNTSQEQRAYDTYQQFAGLTSEPSALVNARIMILERKLADNG